MYAGGVLKQLGLSLNKQTEAQTIQKEFKGEIKTTHKFCVSALNVQHFHNTKDFFKKTYAMSFKKDIFHKISMV